MYHDLLFSNCIKEDFAHKPLERCWCICEAKGKDSTFVQTGWGSESCRMSITWMNSDLPIPLQQVKCAEHCFAFDGRIHNIHPGEEVCVLSSYSIETLIVDAHTQQTIALRCKHSWGPPGWQRGLYKTLGQHVSNLLVNSYALRRWGLPSLAKAGFCTWEKVNSMCSATVHTQFWAARIG